MTRICQLCHILRVQGLFLNRKSVLRNQMWMDHNFFIYYNLWVTTAIIRKLWVKRRWQSQTHDKWQVLTKRCLFAEVEYKSLLYLHGKLWMILVIAWQSTECEKIQQYFVETYEIINSKGIWKKNLEIYASGYWDIVKFWLLKLSLVLYWLKRDKV